MKAKTNFKAKFITVLNVILGVVFAFIMGYTFCAGSFSKVDKTKPYATGAYLANNKYQMINSTESSPVVFGKGNNHVKIAFDYSLYYSFDVRIDYTLSWSNGLPADNVILNYANRDKLLIDEKYADDYATTGKINGYIYILDTISRGTGTINIINSVDFIDPDDGRYEGASLTITTVANVDTSGDYYSDAGLFLENSEVSTVWSTLKSGDGDEDGCSIVVYNKRHNTENGIYHPSGATAYNGNKRLYGNRYYAGAGMFVATRTSSITLTIKGIGTWEKIRETDAGAYDNNIYYTFNSGLNSVWQNIYYDELNHANATITIAANTCVYIDIFESVEITSLMSTDSSVVFNYDDYKMVSTFQIGYRNGDGFNRIITMSSGDKITAVGRIRPFENEDGGYSGSSLAYSITNTSSYNPGLFDASKQADSNYYTNFSITNKTAETKQFTVNYQTQYTISNGEQLLDDWTRTSAQYSTEQIDVCVAPYSTVSLLNKISVESNLYVSLNSSDAWIDLKVISVSVESVAKPTATNSVSVETRSVATDGGNYNYFYLRNNANTAVAVSAGTVNLEYWSKEYDTSYLNQATAPSDWGTQYWEYYQIVDGKYVQATDKSVWAIGTYYKLSISSTSANITISSTTLAPNEELLIKTVQQEDNKFYIVKGSVSATVSTTDSDLVGMINKTSTKSYIKNSSQTYSYYVRFKGTLASTMSNVVTAGGFNYYIGIIRPGQIISIPTANTTAPQTESFEDVVECIQVAKIYKSSDLSAWGTLDSSVITAFESFFN